MEKEKTKNTLVEPEVAMKAMTSFIVVFEGTLNRLQASRSLLNKTNKQLFFGWTQTTTSIRRTTDKVPNLSKLRTYCLSLIFAKHFYGAAAGKSVSQYRFYQIWEEPRSAQVRKWKKMNIFKKM